MALVFQSGFTRGGSYLQSIYWFFVFVFFVSDSTYVCILVLIVGDLELEEEC